jgi:cathepsin E
MFSNLCVLPTAVLALTISAAGGPTKIRDSLVSLPIAKRFKTNGTLHLLEHDQRRAMILKDRGAAHRESRTQSIPAINEAVSYMVEIGVGTPPTKYSLIVDSGSSNTWLGAGKSYRKTSSSQPTNDTVSVLYGSGQFLGDEYTDTVAIGPGLTISEQSIGVATQTEGFNGVDGILGIGPAVLTRGTLNPHFFAITPTVTDNLFSQQSIPQNIVSVSFEPTTHEVAVNGEVTFGGVDHRKFTGPLTFTPASETFPSSHFWGIHQSIALGSTTIQPSTVGIVDTGTTLILISTDAFAAYATLTGGVIDEVTGLLILTRAQFAKLPSLFFTIGQKAFELTPNAQIWPRALNTFIGGERDTIYLIVNSIGTPTGTGLDFVNGMSFLERFYSVYDTTNQRIGFATTPFTKAVVN